MSKSTISRFENDVLRMVLILGLLRTIIELYINASDVSAMHAAIDFSFFIVFLSGLIFSNIKVSHRYLIYFFYIPLVILIPFSLYEIGGVTSGHENTIFVGVLILTLTLKGKTPAKLVIILVSLTIMSLTAVHISYPTTPEPSAFSTGKFNFLFMSLGAIIVIYYSKVIFDKRNRMLENTQDRLHDLNQNIEKKTEKIATQNQEIQELNEYMELEIREQIKKLERQKTAMNQYVQVILEELVESHQRIKTTVSNSTGKSEIDQMIIDSANRLEVEVKLLKEKVVND